MRCGTRTRPGRWPLAITVFILQLMMISAFPPAYAQSAQYFEQSRLPEYFHFQNEDSNASQANWLSIQLVAGGPISHDAIGTKVYLTTNDGYTEIQEISANLETGKTPLVHFHMGQTTPEQVRVVWPNGHTQIFTDVPINQVWKLEYDDTNTLSWEQIIGLGALTVAFVLIVLMTMWRQSANDMSKIFSWRK